MKLFLYITIIATILSILLFIVHKIFSKIKGVYYPVKDDPNEQTSYNFKKNSKIEKLSLKDRLEYSWKFLYDISDKVMKFFSNEDQAEVELIGRNLYNLGMKYEHVVDLAISAQTNHQQEQSTNKSNTQISI